MWPFVDPATRDKVAFGTSTDKALIKNGRVANDQLIVECGGDLVVRPSLTPYQALPWKREKCQAHDRCRITMILIGKRLFLPVLSVDVHTKTHSDEVLPWSVDQRLNGEVDRVFRERLERLSDHFGSLSRPTLES